MIDPDEAHLSTLAKKMLATPHKNRDESKVGAKADARPRKDMLVYELHNSGVIRYLLSADGNVTDRIALSR